MLPDKPWHEQWPHCCDWDYFQYEVWIFDVIQECPATAALVQFSSDTYSEDRNNRSPEFFMPVLRGQYTLKYEHFEVFDSSDAL